MDMDKKTLLTQSIPEFMDDWNNYKKGLKNLKITDWCVSSDYCFDNAEKMDTATFTIFPISCMKIIYNEIKNHFHNDIKSKSHFSDKELEYLKESPYFFSISVIIDNLKNSFNEDIAKAQISEALKFYKETPNVSLYPNAKEVYKQYHSLYSFLTQRGHSKKMPTYVFFVSQLIGQILEFLLIKENGRCPRWCSDRGHITTFQQGIIFTLMNNYLYKLIRNRVNDYRVALPAELQNSSGSYMYDPFIRIPDIITGAISSLTPIYNGLTGQQQKHRDIIAKSIVDNKKIITLSYNFDEKGQPEIKRIYFESVEKCPILKHNPKLKEELLNTNNSSS